MRLAASAAGWRPGIRLQEPRLIAGGGFQAELVVAGFGGDATLGGALEGPFEDQIRLLNLPRCGRLLSPRPGPRTPSPPPAGSIRDGWFLDTLGPLLRTV